MLTSRDSDLECCNLIMWMTLKHFSLRPYTVGQKRRTRVGSRKRQSEKQEKTGGLSDLSRSQKGKPDLATRAR